MDTQVYIQSLLDAQPLRESALRSAIQALRLSPGSHGVDVGCGIGLQTLLLAEAVGEQGYVTGVDIEPEFLALGEKLAKQAGFSMKVAFRKGSLECLPFGEDAFDWAWSSDCIGYPHGELAPVLQELMRVVKPGGSVAVLAWSSQQVLPGYPLLEARLNGACSSYEPFLKGKNPQHHFLRAMHGFRQAGMKDIKAQTFVGEVCSPLNEAMRKAMISLFEMLWIEPPPGAPMEDWQEYLRLCKPESPDFILDIPDYYAFFTYTLFWGKTPNK
jgi:ubiquinone/menaquinone biosynthesis C-methylase UbiE